MSCAGSVTNLRAGVPWLHVIGREDPGLAADHAGPPIPFFAGHHDDVSLLEAEVSLFAALVGVHGHIL